MKYAACVLAVFECAPCVWSGKGMLDILLQIQILKLFLIQTSKLLVKPAILIHLFILPKIILLSVAQVLGIPRIKKSLLSLG